jgi:hypothetical protein
MTRCNIAFRGLAGALAGGFLAACASGQAGVRQAATQEGVYRFTERLTDATPPVLLEGILTVTADTIELTMSPGPCRYEPTGPQTVVRYDCGGVVVSIDRTQPLNRTSYVTSVMVRVPVRTCVAVENTPQGQRCVRYANTYEERRVTRSGRLRLLRIAE